MVRPVISASRIPVSTNSRMIAVSRRSVKPDPLHAASSALSGSRDSTGTGSSGTFGACIPAIGSAGSSSSAVSHLVNCCSDRYRNATVAGFHRAAWSAR